MTVPQDGYRPLSITLIQRIVLLSVVCMLLTGSLKAYLAYRDVQADFQRAVRTVAENSLPLLSTALWDIEIHAVQRQVDWLATLPEVGQVRVQANTGHAFSAGARDGRDDQATVLDIIAEQGGSKLGWLAIWPKHTYYSQRVIHAVGGVIVDYVVLTLLVCLVVNWILRRELQHPLRQIAHFAVSLKPNELAQPLRVERHSRRHADEIDLVVSGFHQLQADLRNHIETLDATVAERTRQLNEVVSEVQRLSVIDPLTGCHNRRLLDQRLPAEVERSYRYRRPLSVVFVDVDHFKRINDQWGHAVGDAVLREVAQRLQKAIRAQIDWVARYGGEEFLVVLPERDRERATEVAERLRLLIESQPVVHDGTTIPITASFGVSEYVSGDGVASLLARADAMLYAAKHQGRNRVLVAPPPDDAAPQQTQANA